VFIDTIRPITVLGATNFAAVDRLGRRALFSPRLAFGGSILLLIFLTCLLTLPLTLNPKSDFYFDLQHNHSAQLPPQATQAWMYFGTTKLGQSLLGRCLIGGLISLTIGIAAAAISVFLGVAVGLVAGYRGGWIDSLLMRAVDVLYGLPYILLVILFKIALERPLNDHLLHSSQAANLVVLFLAIGLVSWLTMARVIRGQVLLLRSMPFVDAARAAGIPQWRIFLHHLLPNLIGPITVYATLTIPQAILQESMLSFLGIGIQPPLPTWGSLASDGMTLALNPIDSRWWLLVFPCTLLAVTLLSLNFLGDGLRDLFDPKRTAANI
jgi:ABC-type dipeptide/oligopeptide/nickel transport system permease subunit